MDTYIIKKIGESTLVEFTDQKEIELVRSSLMLAGVEAKDLLVNEHFDPDKPEIPRTWTLSVSGTKNKDAEKLLAEGKAAIEGFIAYAAAQNVPLALPEVHGGKELSFIYKGDSGEKPFAPNENDPAYAAYLDAQLARVQAVADKPEVAPLFKKLQEKFSGATMGLMGGEASFLVPVDQFSKVHTLNKLSGITAQTPPKVPVMAAEETKPAISLPSVSIPSASLPTAPIKAPVAVAVNKKYKVTEKAPGVIEVEFTNAQTAVADAQYAQALMLLAGTRPEAMELTPDTWETAQSSNKITIKGMNEAQFDTHYTRGKVAVQKLKDYAAKSLQIDGVVEGEEAGGSTVKVAAPIIISTPKIRYSSSGGNFEVVFPCPEWKQENQHDQAAWGALSELLSTPDHAIPAVLKDLDVFSIAMEISDTKVSHVQKLEKILGISNIAKIEPQKSAAANVPPVSLPPISVPASVAAAAELTYTITETEGAGITATFPNTEAGQQRAASLRGLLIMSGIDPQAVGIGIAGVRDHETMEQQIVNPELIVVGITKQQFDDFYKEWFEAKTGAAHKLKEREQKKGVADLTPTVRIRSNGEVRPAFSFTLDNINQPHSKTIAKFNEYNIPAKEAQVDETHNYIDMVLEPNTNYLPNLQAYIASPALSISHRPAGVHHK